MNASIFYIFCQACGCRLHRDRLKVGYCPACQRAMAGKASALIGEAQRLIRIAEQGGFRSLSWEEALFFCRLVVSRIHDMEDESGLSLVDANAMSAVEEFMRRKVSPY